MSDISMGGQDAARSSAAFDRRFYLAAWRWHFYAGIFVVPFMLILAVTGMAMMYIGYFDGRDGDKFLVSVPEQAVALSVADQSEAAIAALPGSSLVEWIRPPASERASVFRVKTEGGEQMMVAVNPYDGAVLETWSRRQGWYDFADNIHSDLLLGTTGDRILEIAAGFGIVLVITGLYLWWPRGTSFASAFIPRLSGSGRTFWKQLHLSTGIYVSAFLLLFLLSGMAWTGVWGGKLVQAWSTFPAEKWNNVPLSDETHASMNHGAVEDVPWALELTPMPASGSDVGVDGTLAGEPVTVDTIAALAGRIGFSERFRVAFPKNATGVWTINQDTMSADATDPFADRTVHVDQYTGKVLASVGFADYSLGGKAMAVSIPLHMGLVTVWNLVLNTLVCLMIIGLSVSGVVMWWLRRPSKGAARLFAPQIPADLPHWRGAMLVMLAVSLFFPLVGLTLVAVLFADVLVLSRIPQLRKAIA
ncbi:PepSY-associated TM helix domain-containing protein [Roseibium sp.]|uniref:PepSY-associated TM helix domain-containing protein n=1 Tax=Roseibium sp. TaxID=1936156 RepID=UPI003A974713